LEKIKINRTILKILGFFMVIFSLTGCGIRKNTPVDQWSRINKEKRVIIGCDDTFVPMGFQDKKGKLVGFDVELARAVFAKFMIRVDFQAIDWDMKETELRNGTIDLIWNGYSKNKEREKLLLFSKTYMINNQIVVTKKTSKITSFAQMKGKILGAQAASAGYEILMEQPKILKNYIKGDPVLFDGFSEAFLDLKAGRIAGLLIDRVYASYYLNKSGELKFFNSIIGGFENEDFAVGARKSDKKMVKKINKAFDELHESGEFQKISKKWFGQDVWPRN